MIASPMRVAQVVGFVLSCSVFAARLDAQSPHLAASLSPDGNSLTIVRQGVEPPVLTHVALPTARPYLHPLLGADGKTIITQANPDHHPHQTGIYHGFTRLNGRDYFHNFGETHWRRVALNILKPLAQDEADSVQWQCIYELLDEKGKPILKETQDWTMRLASGQTVLDFHWSGEAVVDATIGKYDYGGLFIRMPWTQGIEGEIVSNTRQRNERAEGKRAVWLDVGMDLPGSSERQHIAVFDHPDNEGFPLPWRVDKQLGLGTARARHGDWKIPKGHTERIRHRLVVYDGKLNDVELTNAWTNYTGLPKDSIQWRLAQEEGRRAQFLSPEQAASAMTLPEEFTVDVFAAEPMIGQPMAFCWDPKGRLWVAENRDYETRQTGFSSSGDSRILILEDTDRDGKADSKKVFLEGIPFPSAMAVGFDGLWLGAPPNLLFVPDHNKDDQADLDAIEVRLTGWGILDRHETLNSFAWGPDGWLYGLQGFATPSVVGKPKGLGRIYKPGEPFPTKVELSEPGTDINGGVWRYHPTKDRFEVVAHGFSNPWGIDFDQHGQCFITACVIPHLWHVVPGGIYQRQGGSHFSPYVYNDIQTIADHRHQSAHGGARVYQSDAFPEKYHSQIFMANIHEHAVLTDVLENRGSGFIGHHGEDFLLANNAQWVGFSIEIGPDGAVYVLDWHDADICGKEVMNKDTGRIFRIAPKSSKASQFAHRNDNLETLGDRALAELQAAPSVWHATTARTILQHRASKKPIQVEAIDHLKGLVESRAPSALRLRGLWTMHAVQALKQSELAKLLNDTDQHVRAWAVQLLCEDNVVDPPIASQLTKLCRDEPSPIVRLALAAASQRLADRVRWEMIEGLAQHSIDRDDHNIPCMLWFSTEPMVNKDVLRSLTLASSSQIPQLTRSIARRLSDEGKFDEVIKAIDTSNAEAQLSMLLGVRDAIDGRFDLQPPAAWSELNRKLQKVGGEIAKVAQQCSQQFGDSEQANRMLASLKSRVATSEEKMNAIRVLAGRRHAQLKDLLPSLFNDTTVRKEAIRAVAAYDEATLAKKLLDSYPKFSEQERSEVIRALSSRTSLGNELTKAIAVGRVPKEDVPAQLARVLRRVVGNKFVDVWGPIDGLGSDKEALFARYRELLTERALKGADLGNGRNLFKKSCVACHKLHDEGGNVGPDITGANRANLEYLLSNILTPSAIIQDAYRMHMILTVDGRIYSGIPVEESERMVKLRVADRPEPVSIPVADIESREIAPNSMMPDGIFTNLKDSEVIDLVGYLQSANQVPTP